MDCGRSQPVIDLAFQSSPLISDPAPQTCSGVGSERPPRRVKSPTQVCQKSHDEPVAVSPQVVGVQPPPDPNSAQMSVLRARLVDGRSGGVPAPPAPLEIHVRTADDCLHSGDACCRSGGYLMVHYPQPKSAASLTLTGTPGMAASAAGNGSPGPDPWSMS